MRWTFKTNAIYLIIEIYKNKIVTLFLSYCIDVNKLNIQSLS